MNLSLDLDEKKVTDFKTVRTVYESQVRTFSDGSVEAVLVNTYNYVLGKKAKKYKEKKQKTRIEIEEEGEM